MACNERIRRPPEGAEGLIDIRVVNPDAVTLEQLTAVADFVSLRACNAFRCVIAHAGQL